MGNRNPGSVTAFKSGSSIVVYTIQQKPADIADEAHIANTYHHIPVHVSEIDRFIDRLAEIRDVIQDQQNYSPSQAAREKVA